MAPPPPPLPPLLHPNHNPGATFHGQREDSESGNGDNGASGDGEAQPTQTRNARTRPMTGTAMPRLLVWTPPTSPALSKRAELSVPARRTCPAAHCAQTRVGG